MACDGDYDRNSFQPWARVRPASTLFVAVESESDTITAGARLLIDHPDGTTEERLWEDSEVRPGPMELGLQAGRMYALRVRVGFSDADEAEAVITARILRPNGSVHGKPYDYCVSGVNGDVGRSTITIAMRSD